MNRRAQAVVLLLVGGAVLRTSISDLYLRYVKQGLRPFLIAAGILLVATAIMTLWYDLRPHVSSSHDERAHADSHGHSHEPRVAWMLLFPVLALLLIAPPALGAYAANHAGTVLSAPTSDFAPLPEGDPVRVSLLDYASRAVYDQGRSLADRHLELSGFVTTGADGEVFLTRMILSCCAADARPIKVGLTGEVPPGLKPDTWLKVIGGYSPRRTNDPVNGEPIPYLEVGRADVIDPPVEPYEI